MNNEFKADIAYDLGSATANQAAQYGDAIMNHEKRRRQLAYEATIAECKANLKLLADERDELRMLIRRIAPSGINTASQRRYYVIAASILILGSVCFTHLAFVPYGLGGLTWVIAIAVSLGCAVLAEPILEVWGKPQFVGVISSLGILAVVAGLVALAQLRADVLMMHLKIAFAHGTDNPTTNSAAATFYAQSIPLLKVVFASFAVGLEIASSLAISTARRLSSGTHSLVEQTQKRLTEIEPTMACLVGRITFLQNEPQAFEAEFLRDFHLGLRASNVLKASSPLSKFGLAVLLWAALGQSAQGQSNVIADDFSISTSAARTSDGQSEYQKNLDTTAKLISQLPAGSRFSVIGITQSTFSSPLMLHSGQIPAGPGPLEFLNQIDLARARYANGFRKAAERVKVTAKKTDIIGAVFVAKEIFQAGPPGRHNLVFFSDMRHSTAPVDIETPRIISVKSAIAIVEHHHLIPDLQGIDVWIMGVDAAGKDIAYWNSLREFWTVYFKKAGATLHVFSMTRELPDLAHTLRERPR